MSCEDVNPCDPCSEYDNCGCPNPTTFGCVTHSGTALPCLGVANNEDGDSILTKIDAKVCDIGKVKATDTDTCLGSLIDKLEPGVNISISETGEGCEKKIRIDAVEGGTPPDINVKITAADTISGYLNDKVVNGIYTQKTIVTPGANEKLKIDVVPANLISGDLGNQLGLGGDGKLITLYSAPDGSETKIIEGAGVDVSGTGTIGDPYIIATNPSIQATRACFDGVWRNLTLIATGNASVVYNSGNPQYRYRFDGTIEFRGSITHTVAFGTTIGTREFIITLGAIPVTCITLGELAGSADLKGVNYVLPQAPPAEQYGYIIRKSTQNIQIKFQSSFTIATSKTIITNFEGAVIHPLI